MKKEYIVPEFEFNAVIFDNVFSDVIHASFEQGGQNPGWSFDDDFDGGFDGEFFEDFGDENSW